MTVELAVLGAACLLALVHIFAAVGAKTREYGREWNRGARDDTPAPKSILIGRLSRAQANFFETFPIAVAAILIVSVSNMETIWSTAGALLWLAARILYLPIYAAGIPTIRTLVFLISLVGLLGILASPILH